jgi:hypothetical protein
VRPISTPGFRLVGFADNVQHPSIRSLHVERRRPEVGQEHGPLWYRMERAVGQHATPAATIVMGIGEDVVHCHDPPSAPRAETKIQPRQAPNARPKTVATTVRSGGLMPRCRRGRHKMRSGRRPWRARATGPPATAPPHGP